MGSVRCGLCGKSVPYKPVDVADLGEHLYQSHPNKEVAYFTFDDENDKDDNKRKEKMYKTTVETWKPGISQLTCPSCGKSGQPIIRKQQNKVTHSSLGALCLLGCWPLCFLPFMLGGSNVMNLHCQHCGQHLGTFDRKTGNLRQVEEGRGDTKPCGCRT